MSEVWLAVGLGNPGENYESTRHNAGARAVARLAKDLGVNLSSPKSRLRPGKPAALLAETSTGGVRLILARPTTFMNESGRAVSSLLRWYRAGAERLVVVHDEIDLAEGALRIQFRRGSGGHRGVNSIINSIGTQDFYRIRIGVGRPPPGSHQDPAGYVLEPMSNQAAARLAETEAKAAQAVVALVHDGAEPAMSRYNTR